MDDSAPIRILEGSSNRRGDLFGRLMVGLFFALGYDRIRLNIHKSGREIDVEATHRTEKRRVIAECKATEEPIGGADVNKFVGSLDAERRKQPIVPTEGYFVSLSGFTETAVEQEAELGNARLTLLKGTEVVEQLVKGRVLASSSIAMELAGRCAQRTAADAVPEERCELLAHECGLVWAVYFRRNMVRTHFALVHADGQLIGKELASQIISADKTVRGSLHKLVYLSPDGDSQVAEAEVARARDSYLSYLEKECGEIQLAGLPADQEVGSHHLRLEDIFVPLYLSQLAEPRLPTLEGSVRVSAGSTLPDRKKLRAARAANLDHPKRVMVGTVLRSNQRLALLGLPGSGKSTLLRRMALAYGVPDRRLLIKDHLPKRAWLPLLVRCRQLNGLAKRTIGEVLAEVPVRAEMPDDLHAPFNTLVSRALRKGEILLLIDGLDEIADEASRLSFTHQLRSFLSTYPNVALVITSREAGFRVIGGALSTHCRHYQLAKFDDRDIKKLTLAWHRVVINDAPKTRQAAQKLAGTICATPPVRQLAQNPLLLTTLLLVQRWVGQVPTKRSVLYAKAIEVLLMTWNVEAHQPIDPDEALPQLEFVAFTMMEEGLQRISLARLKDVLTLARKQMPEVLGFARTSIGEFIQQVEVRSSLLMQSGHDIEDGTLYPTYEFQHLTFQEYLAARAIVYGHYPNRLEADTICSVLQPHFGDEVWKEVIPLTAVLAGREAHHLIESLIGACRERTAGETAEEGALSNDDLMAPYRLLGLCLSDEVQLGPETLREAMRCVAESAQTGEVLERVHTSKYGPLFEKVAFEMFKENRNLLTLGGFIDSLMLKEVGFRQWSPLRSTTFRKVCDFIGDGDPMKVAMGCLASMYIAFERSFKGGPKRWGRHSARLVRLRRADKKALEDWLNRVLPLFKAREEYLQFSAVWAFVWLADATQWSPTRRPEVLLDLVALWYESREKSWGYIPAWALSSLPLVSREAFPMRDITPDILQFIRDEDKRGAIHESSAALVLAYYLRRPWTEEELADKVAARIDADSGWQIGGELLKALGGPAEKYLKALPASR